MLPSNLLPCTDKRARSKFPFLTLRKVLFLENVKALLSTQEGCRGSFNYLEKDPWVHYSCPFCRRGTR